MLLMAVLIFVLCAALAAAGLIFARRKKIVPSVEAVAAADLGAPPSVEGLKAQELQEECVRMKEELGAAQELLQQRGDSEKLVAELKIMNEALNTEILGLRSAQEQGPELKARAENVDAEVRRLHDALCYLEQENQLLKASGRVASDMEKTLTRAKEEYQHQIADFFKEIEALRVENVRLQASAGSGARAEEFRQSAEELSGRLREIQSVHAIQEQKNEYLQYELTKSRAQVVGLERLCENMSAVHPLTGRAVNEEMPAGRG